MSREYKGYLTEKSVLEIWAARPIACTPKSKEYTAISRVLAEKFKISTKTVQKVWNRVSWAKVTDRAPVTTKSERQLTTAGCPGLGKGLPADVTADTSLKLGAGMLPDASLPSPHEYSFWPPPPSSGTPLLPHFLSPNAASDCSLLSLGVKEGRNQDSSLLSPPSSHLSHHFSVVTTNIGSHNRSLHADTQAGVDIPQYNTEPWSSWEESNSMPNNHSAAGWSQSGCQIATEHSNLGIQRCVDPTCFHCKVQKLRCDGRQPCGQCCRRGLASECGVEHEEQTPLLPSVAQNADARALSPEYPIAFPDGPVHGESFVVPQSGLDSQWPLSLVRLFKTFRLADSICERMFRLMTPKLRATIIRIFGAIDHAFAKPAGAPAVVWSPKRTNYTVEPKAWHNSLRCGMMKVRLDSSGAVMTGVDANPFWTDLAGLHKEEFSNRAFNGELDLHTSELRQFSKNVLAMKEYVKVKIARLSDPEAQIERKPVFGRFSRNWGRGSATDGVLTRMRGVSTTDEHDSAVMHLHTSLVIVSPAEFEAVRARQPELCEGYLIPVVGSKSAAELMDPRLLVEESFECMTSSPEGRAQLDRLADVIADEFSFMFDLFAE